MIFLIHLMNLLSFTFGTYYINVFPDVLSKEEELILLNEMKLGNNDARSKLIEHNLRLVAHIVKKFESIDNNQDDLISIGTIGLIKGIDSFKIDKNNRLTTYVARCIENEILMYFRSNKKNKLNVSLNDSIGTDKDGNEINLIDVIKSNDKELNELINEKNNNKLLNRIINKLDEREKEIIIKRYGLFNTKEYTQKEIAKMLNISRSYVSRIEKRAISKLYKELKSINIEL